MKTDKTLYVGLAWCPDSKLDSLRYEIDHMKNELNYTGPQIWRRQTSLKPPTYFRTNEFT